MSDTRSTFNLSNNQIGSTTRRNDDVMSDCHSWILTVEDVDKAVRNNCRIGKAAGIDNIVAEHIIYAHPAIIYHLTKLNQLILHSYVPNTFGHAIIVLLVKDRSGDVSKLSNYRCILLSPVISKIFEDFLSNKVWVLKHSSCASAIFVVPRLEELHKGV